MNSSAGNLKLVEIFYTWKQYAVAMDHLVGGKYIYTLFSDV